MVYGRLIYNTCKDYTPTWFKTLPYSQAAKPTFGNDIYLGISETISSCE